MKNKMMRLASLLMVAVLLTTSVVSGTYAKYVTTGNAGDNARVAKWGVKITVQGNDAFAEMYGAGHVVTTDELAATVVSVNATNDTVDKVVAPGTKGQLSSLALEGKPEVDVQLVKEATVTLTGWTVDGTVYCPIQILDESDNVVIDGLTYDNLAELETAIEDLLETGSAIYQANTDLATVGSLNCNYKWYWPYSISTGYDVKDTALGDEAALNNAAKISCNLVVTATQVD